MDRFQELQIFVAVAEEQSFAAAARRLQQSPPPVTRAINSLEKRLGVTLLSRSTRHVRLTDAGEQYLQNARRVLSELEQADELASGVNTEPKGLLSITAPMMFGNLHVVPGVVEYLERYPDTRVSVALLDRVVNLLEEGFDAGIRIGELPDSNMRAIKVGTVRSVVCASDAYLKKHGVPKHPGDLKDHSIICVASSTSQRQWRFHERRKSFSVRVNPRLSTTNVQGCLSAMNSDFGITRMLSYQIEPYIPNGQIRIVLEEFEPPPLPINIIHREGRHVSVKLRAFIDLLAERLGDNMVIAG